ncbi:hypothetical protein U6A24_15805 [Aquimarina gracilis]|uniref:Tetratricopeptide repeat protein n=1 Tax=Aquimarina gracilis TaxID=874422 RepID=A0ABU5ZYH1_9FLAO|nr:hypothetical protein [Aquimarina gracilis]MEB3346939.1 hypothetical protein [Aquimarina gracilis]
MSDFLEEIDKYLDGAMSSEEKRTFEEKANLDATLAEELKLQRDMRSIYKDEEWIEGDKSILKGEEAKELGDFLKSKEAASIKETIKEVIDENRSNSGGRKFYFVGVAAAIAILLSIFIFSESKYDKLYAHYVELDNIPSLITRGEQENELVKKAQLFFEDQKYEEAIQSFSTYQSTNVKSIDPLTYIYTGVSYLEIRDFENALDQFELLEKSNTLHSKKANWYRVLVYLKQGDKEKLRETLKNISSDKNNYNFQKAKELIKKI